MKKIGKICTMIPLLFITTKVNALSATPVITCSSENITSSSNITCDVTVNVSEGSIYAYSGEYEVSSNLDVVTATVDSSKWQGSVVNNKIGVYASDSYSTNTKIGTLTIKLKDSTSSTGSISIKNNTFTDENYGTVNYSGTASKNLTVATTNGNATEKEEKDDKSSSKTSSSNNSTTNKSNNTTKENVEKNPDTGVFAPIITIALLGIITVIIFIYTKKKSLFKKI